MKRLLLTIAILICFASSISAQYRAQRRIYLWDVTLSMKGHNGAPNIYDDVMKFLIQDINSITDESMEVVVLPFQDKILEYWTVQATQSGKKSITTKIEEYDNGKLTQTNIVGSIEMVMQKYISSDRDNILVLLTDGADNVNWTTQLINLIHSWGEFAEQRNAYCLYVMLTKNAIDTKVIDEINRTPRIDVVTEPGKDIKMYQLQPSKIVRLNIVKDDINEPIKIMFTYNSSNQLPDGIQVRVSAHSDGILDIDNTAEIQNSAISVNIKFAETYDVLHRQLSQTESTNIPVHLELINRDEIQQNKSSIVTLTNTDIILELINKPERVLTIHVKI